jgi:hypothetical protein
MAYSHAYLNGADLGQDAYWQDEWDWQPVMQTVRKALDGTLVVEQISPAADGRPITMFCSWVPKTTVNALVALRDRTVQSTMTLTLCDAREFVVIFRHHEGPPLTVKPVLERPDYINQVSPDFYDVTIRLMEIDDDATTTSTT